MVQQQIVQYIVENLNKGYDINQIRNYLISNGWNQYQVDEAIQYIYSYYNNQLPLNQQNNIFSFFKKKFSFYLLGSFIFLISIVIIFLIFSLKPINGDPVLVTQNLEYTLSIDSKKIQPGQDLKFYNNFKGDKEANGYALYFSFKIVDSENRNTIIRWNENNPIIIGDKKLIEKKIDSNFMTGSYILIAETTYRGRKIESFDSFIVYKESSQPTCFDGIQNQGEIGIDCGGPCKACPTCFDGIQNQGETGIDCGGPCKLCEETCPYDCNDFDLCTEDICENGKCKNIPIFPCCGNLLCEEGENEENCIIDCMIIQKSPNLMSKSEILSTAKNKAEQNTKDAGLFCDEINNSDFRDDCFKTIAVVGKNKLFCDYIINSMKKDSCLIDFAMTQYDYSVCIQINNEYLRKSCESLKIRPSP
jgi:hypothetical protein